MKKSNAVAVKAEINELLNELVAQRVSAGSFINTKVSVVADLIIRAHKKECK